MWGEKMKLLDKNELTGRENMVMKCVWDHEGDISAVEIQRALKEQFGIDFERSTITTFILHLREKGYLDLYKVGQVYYYKPLVKEEDYVKKQTKKFMNFWFDGSVSALLSAFTGDESEDLNEESIDRIQSMIDDME